jgi:hypothetical protein
MNRLPRTIIHADWSVSPRKRWAATAILNENGDYQVRAPTLVTPLALLEAAKSSALIGFDFPIGIPAAYATIAGVRSFVDWLPLLGGTEPWSAFFEPVKARTDISIYQPFYPHAPGGAKREHLVEALRLAGHDSLYRACEIANGRRACPLFWTLGGNQVGKGALTGWQEFLQPARKHLNADILQFDGSFEELLDRGRTVVVETYPADVYSYVGASLPKVNGQQGKRDRASRAESACGIVDSMQSSGHVPSPALVEQLRDGFGQRSDGEDRFDAVIGLLGMLAVVRDNREIGIPSEQDIHAVEGWILGRTARRR